ncbi:hypothetical protein [Actinomyces bovis]|nr:hypothetical protein [Actinomyces bovis]
MQVTQVDTYVKGAKSYNTTTTVTNTGSKAAQAVLYHGADCYLQDDDRGWGEYDAAKQSVICRAKDNEGKKSTNGRIEEFVPTTDGSNYFYGFYRNVWETIATKQPLPNKLEGADEYQDNGMALSWNLNLSAGESKSYSMITNFSPLGEVALPTKIQAAADSANKNQHLVTATITNPNSKALDAKSATVVLPEGISYVAGSVQGAGAPTVNQAQGGKTELVFPAFKLAGNGADVTFTFKVSGAVSQEATLELKGETVQGVPVVGSSTTIAATAPSPSPTPTPSMTPTASPTPAATPTPSSEATPSVAPTTTAPAPSPQPTVMASPAPTAKPAKKGLAVTGVNLGVGAVALGVAALGGVLLLRRRKA